MKLRFHLLSLFRTVLLNKHIWFFIGIYSFQSYFVWHFDNTQFFYPLALIFFSLGPFRIRRWIPHTFLLHHSEILFLIFNLNIPKILLLILLLLHILLYFFLETIIFLDNFVIPNFILRNWSRLIFDDLFVLILTHLIFPIDFRPLLQVTVIKYNVDPCFRVQCFKNGWLFGKFLSDSFVKTFPSFPSNSNAGFFDWFHIRNCCIFLYDLNGRVQFGINRYDLLDL